MTSRESIEVAACRLVTGELPAESLPQLATDALVDGLDSPSLRLLAGQAPGDVRDSRDLFEQVLDELAIEIPDVDAAHWRLVTRAATDIVARRVDPVRGAGAMWDAYVDVRDSGDLRIFVGLLSELDDHPGDRQQIADQIVREAELLRGRGAPRMWVRLMAHHGGSPVTRTNGNGSDEVGTANLPLTPGLRSDIGSWVSRYEDALGGWPDSGGFRTVAEAETFVDEGRDLATRLQDELGPGYVVEYMPEPIRAPGVKLRRSRLQNLLGRRLEAKRAGSAGQ